MTEPSERERAAWDRYSAALHAVQSGIAMQMNYDGGPESGETSPKHLRVGISSAMITDLALAQLLIDKGIFTAEEYAEAVADAAEREKALYEGGLNRRFPGGPRITLG